MSPYLIAALAGWVASQGAKYVIKVARTGSLGDYRQLYISGGMPSAHSATVVAIAMMIGLRDGVESGLFGLAALFAGIVMYDAVMVRRSSGAQGLVLRKLLKETNSGIQAPKVAKGHEPLEVLAGAAIGAVVGYVVFLVTI